MTIQELREINYKDTKILNSINPSILIQYFAFDAYNKTDKCQLFMFQVTSPGQKLYAEPSYQSALNWVVLDGEMSQYHKANILNSINVRSILYLYPSEYFI